MLEGYMKFKKLHEDAVIPAYQSDEAAGVDLHTIDDYVLLPGQQKLLKTGLAVEIPMGAELQLRPRSGNALKSWISVTNSPGTLDSDYRGPIGIILINHHPEKFFVIKKGDRIAQAVLCPIIRAKISEVEELSETNRGSGGYGSTGK